MGIYVFVVGPSANPNPGITWEILDSSALGTVKTIGLTISGGGSDLSKGCK
jgi:hypothetical protein